MELVSNACAQLFPDNTLSSFTNILPEQLKLEGQGGGSNFGILLPINVPKCHRGEVYVFRQKTFRVI